MIHFNLAEIHDLATRLRGQRIVPREVGFVPRAVGFVTIKNSKKDGLSRRLPPGDGSCGPGRSLLVVDRARTLGLRGSR
jgi:hypothetical protein